MRAARRSHQPVSVVMLDIDHFKRINDVHGHDAGDRALRQIARMAGHALRASDRLGRLGGEEFLLVLPATAATTAMEIAERARRAIAAASFDAVTPGQRVTISLGVATTSAEPEDAAALLKRADAALYRAKTGGRDRVAAADDAGAVLDGRAVPAA
jgi:diguanylate cyclase (GGDEF)-like protein